MAIIDDVSARIVDAMRRQDRVTLSALRMLKTALTNKSVEKGRTLDDNESKQVVVSLVKQRKDAIEQFEKGNRPDLVQKEQADLEVLEAFLPPALDSAAIERAVRDAIAETGAISPKDTGRVMKAVMGRLSGQTVDGKLVSDLVRARLAEGVN
jgi:uncharacterized protein YqeY